MLTCAKRDRCLDEFNLGLGEEFIRSVQFALELGDFFLLVYVNAFTPVTMRRHLSLNEILLGSFQPFNVGKC